MLEDSEEERYLDSSGIADEMTIDSEVFFTDI
jgi:hypothetical protein